MMDKKTLFMMLGLGLIITFAFFYIKPDGKNIPEFFNFNNYLTPQESTDSGKKSSFSDLLVTITPTETPFPTMEPF